MPTTEAVNPFEYFTDTEGNPLEGGNIYVGVFGADAQANPITIFSDDSLTTQISNPVRTTRGVPFVGGAAVKIFTGSAYSIKVTQANDVLVYSANVNPLLEGATGVAIFAAGTEAEAQTALGGGTAGRAVFVSDTQAQVRTAAGLGDAATRNMSDVAEFSNDGDRIADRAAVLTEINRLIGLSAPTEGAFSPSLTTQIGGSVSFDPSLSSLFWYRIGKLVFVTGYLEIDAVSSPSGFVNLTMPFAAEDTGNTASAPISQCDFIDASAGTTEKLSCVIFVGLAQMRIGEGERDGNTYAVGDALRFTFTYRTSD